MIRWGAAHLLIWIWIIIPLAGALFFLRRRKEKRLQTLLHRDIIPELAPRYHRLRARTRNIIWLVAVLLCLIALAQLPQWGFHWDEVRRRGLDIMVVLDTSKSMLTEDIKPNRLQQAKWGIRDLLQKLRGDRIGLVTFAGSAFLQCPLTIDYAAFLMSLDDVYAGIIPRGGTAIGTALEKAVENFEYDQSGADKVIILVTDGEDHDGDPARWISDLKKKNIRVYSIGVGTLEGELIPQLDQSGRPGFLKDQGGQVVKSALNENALQQLALSTGGIYVRSAPGDFGLERIYDHGIDQLQRDEQESRMVRIYEDRYYWFVLGALVLLILEATISRRKLLPKKATALLVLAFLCSQVPTARAADNARTQMDNGLQAYEEAESAALNLSGITREQLQQNPQLQQDAQQAATRYKQAAGAFTEAAEQADEEKDLDPSEAYYNLANTYYRLNDMEKAGQAYQNALASPDLNLQSKAYYNRGNALMAMATQQQQQQQQPQMQPDAEAPKPSEIVEHALNAYEKSILLNPEDPDAKTNFELALKIQEQMKQQEQQQQQQQKNQDKNQEDQQDQQKDQQDQQKEDQQKDQQDQQNKDQQQKDQQDQQDQQKEDQQKDQQDQQDQQQKEQQDQQKEQQQDQQDQQEQQQQQAQPKKAEEMTPQEARMMLNAMRNEEKAQRDAMRMIMGAPEPPQNGKDW